ncbi:DUF6625 family protein [Lactobacillus amylovorus]|uniref:DUF6625 family protein n=1 Tax=Lactobacillus amylovorus TaxID=1604 RepID=UPI003F8AFCB5
MNLGYDNKREKSKAEICMLIPYFGKFPEWFNLYLYSCSKVKKIDFYFFTDCQIPSKIYDNTKFIKITYHHYCDLVSRKLNLNFFPSSPYSLVNVRPFMNIIHSNIAENYRFWGFSDIDLVYGDTSYILDPRFLDKYDLITTHSDRVAGHFTIIKRDGKYDKIALKIKNWRKKIVSKKAGFDEKDFSEVVYPPFILLGKLWWHLFSKFMPSEKMYYFYNIAHKLIRSKALFLECYTTPIPRKNDVWIYDLKSNSLSAPKRFNNRKLLGNNPLPYLHFLFFKKTPYLKTNVYWRNGFYKIPEGFNFDGNKQILITWTGITIKSD